MKFNWRDLPWKTLAGVVILVAQGVAYARANRWDQAAEAFGIAVVALGIRSGVAKDQAATQAVSDKLDDAHAAVIEAHSAIARTEAKMDAVVAASSDSIPVAKNTVPPER